MLKKRKNSKENLLTMKPVLKEKYRLQPRSPRDESSGYELIVPRTGWLERFSIRFLRQPALIRVRLDDLGSFVLSHCNGGFTVEEIADRLQERFGEEAEPVLPRLVKYLQIVEANEWIRMERPQTSR
ncbi:PqqD family protein [Paludifilum halophilum]|uniref:PqqD family protein n=1 Tax=Paludifilum halophilum TaxID=1642702 RepID=A0A235B4G5_9BACL|nr:PqqD family protein [Paludifilum halophilum]OYD07206.1 PqqD family protein [Paludifilum halophilum]